MIMTCDLTRTLLDVAGVVSELERHRLARALTNPHVVVPCTDVDEAVRRLALAAHDLDAAATDLLAPAP